jgi:hypothetical protein
VKRRSRSQSPSPPPSPPPPEMAPITTTTPTNMTPESTKAQPKRPLAPLVCKCGVGPVCRLSKTPKNPGREFWACRRGRGGCSYFEWKDLVGIRDLEEDNAAASADGGSPAADKSVHSVAVKLQHHHQTRVCITFSLLLLILYCIVSSCMRRERAGMHLTRRSHRRVQPYARLFDIYVLARGLHWVPARTTTYFVSSVLTLYRFFNELIFIITK